MTEAPEPAFEVRRARPDEWAVLRAVRLAALRDAPYAFASTYADNAAFDESRWRQRIASSAPFLAWPLPSGAGERAGATAQPVGLATGIADADEPADERHLVSMWVAPRVRGTGVADALVAAVRAWAAGDGATAVNLWVVDGNERALRFYTRLGFRDTGDRQPFPPDPSVTERRLQLRW